MDKMDKRLLKLMSEVTVFNSGLSQAEKISVHGTVCHINSMQVTDANNRLVRKPHFITKIVSAIKGGFITTRVELHNGTWSELKKEYKHGATVELGVLYAHLRASSKTPTSILPKMESTCGITWPQLPFSGYLRIEGTNAKA